MTVRNLILISAVLFILPAITQSQEPGEWFPYLEAEGRVSTDRSVVRGNIFAPVWQSEESFFFFDIRGLTTNQDANEGNVGFGYRKLIGPDRLVGFFGYYDFRETEFGNQFHQGSLGAEMLSSKWGFRINGYLPEEDAQVVSQFNTAFLSGNNVFVRQGLEAAYWGADLEMERLLWTNTENGKGGKAPLKVAELDAEWWASVGYFHFDRSDSRFESISGPRARMELRLWNLPLLGNDSRVILTGQYEYDDVRGSVGTAGLSVRIPIGRYQSTAAPLSGIRRRMLESVVRDVDIVTNAGAFGNPERAKFARTGELINGTVSVNGNTADPEAAIEGAGDNSLVLASGGAGIISPVGTVDMNTGQVILGGGSVIGVVGCDTGAHATFTAPGTRPNFRSDIIANFAGATNGSIIGVDFGSSLDGSLGLTLTNVSNFLLDDVAISTLGINNQGSGITATKSQFTVVNSRIIVPGNRGDGIDALTGTENDIIVRNTFIDAGDDGIDLEESTLLVEDSTIISQDDTLDISGGSTVTVIRSTLINDAFSGAHSVICAGEGARVTILDSTLIQRTGFLGVEAVDIGGSASFVMRNSTLIANDSQDAFEVANAGEFILENSTIRINGTLERSNGIAFDYDESVNGNIRIANNTIIDTSTIAGSQTIQLVTSNNAPNVNIEVTNNRITTVNPGLSVTANSAGSTINLDARGNTITSGAAFNDIELIQTTGALNVVNFPNLSPNNNGATIGTTGTIGDITVLP